MSDLTMKEEKEKENVLISINVKNNFLIFIDGYCRKQTYRQSYITIDLCHLIMEYFIDILDFFIVFENGVSGKTNELLYFNFENSKKTMIENPCWKYSGGMNYCIGNKIINDNNNNNLNNN